jgi:hypothetical protein
MKKNIRETPVSMKSASVKNQYMWEVLLKTWQQYLTITTIPGLQNVHHASGRLSSCIWTILFIVGFACTVRDVYTTTTEYLAYPVITSMTMDQVEALPFPSVTVCNLNRIHCTNLRKLAAQHWGTELGKRLFELHTLTSCHVDFSWEPIYQKRTENEGKQGQHSTYSDKTSRNTRHYLKQKFEDLTTIPAEDSSSYTKV